VAVVSVGAGVGVSRARTACVDPHPVSTNNATT
jgi:hypothetical protein